MRKGGEWAEVGPASSGPAARTQPEELRRRLSPGGRPRLPAPRRPSPAPAFEADGHPAARAAAAGASAGVCAAQCGVL